MNERTYADLSPDEKAKVDAEARRIMDLLAESLNRQFDGEMITESLRARIRDECMRAIGSDSISQYIDVQVIQDPADKDKLKVTAGNSFTAFTMFAMANGLRPPPPGYDSDTWKPDSDVVKEMWWDKHEKTMHVTYAKPVDFIELNFKVGEPHDEMQGAGRPVIRP